MAKVPSNLKECDKLLSSLVKRTGQSLKNAPEGSLKISIVRGHTRYCHRLSDANNTCVYLSEKEDADLIRRLAQKDYDKKALRLLKEKSRAVKMLLNIIHKHFPLRSDNISEETLTNLFPYMELDEIFDSMCPQRQNLVTPVVPTTAQYVQAWLNEPYEGKSFRADDRSAYYTIRGERVRSKSEVLIANALSYAGIPYKYECPLQLDTRTLYPDFTILDIRTRHEVYLEHCGMLGDPDYANEFVWKMNFYDAHDITPDKNLILTVESSGQPLDTRTMERIIDRRFERREPLPATTAVRQHHTI